MVQQLSNFLHLLSANFPDPHANWIHLVLILHAEPLKTPHVDQTESKSIKPNGFSYVIME